MKNEGKNAHTFTSTALNVDKTLQPGQDMDVQVMLPQTGATEFHCNFHQSQGMQGAFFFNAGDAVAGSGAGRREQFEFQHVRRRLQLPELTSTDYGVQDSPRSRR